MNKYIIYCHTNKKNNKKYIGQTGQSPEKRWGKNGSEYLRKGNPYFKNAILKYGWDNFTHEILFTNLSAEEADNKEMELIKKYKTYLRDYGYNMTMGGNSNTLTPEQKEQISKRNKLYWENGKFQEVICKNIYCVELNYEFKSVTEAHQKTGIDISAIIKVCKGLHNYAGFSPKGQPLHWLYSKDVTVQKIEDLKNKKEIIKGIQIPIMCIETQQIFHSSTEAGKYYKIHPNNIRSNIQGRQKSAGKDLINNTPLHWKDCPELIDVKGKMSLEQWEELYNA